jgi:spermidine synthase
MLVHPAMFTHAVPRRVVIVGGGDGGTVREVLRHAPEEVVVLELDEEVVRASQEHLPEVGAGAFDDPRVELVLGDAVESLARFEGAFDVAIVDSSGPSGPARSLVGEDFYALLARALDPGGVSSFQTGSLLDFGVLRELAGRVSGALGQVTGFRATIPSYNCGEYLFLVASRHLDSAGPDRAALTRLQEQREIRAKHWSPGGHHASQELPSGFTLT